MPEIPIESENLTPIGPLDAPDNRVINLRKWINAQIAFSPLWTPTIKQIIQISDDFKVTGKTVLDIFEEITL